MALAWGTTSRRSRTTILFLNFGMRPSMALLSRGVLLFIPKGTGSHSNREQPTATGSSRSSKHGPVTVAPLASLSVIVSEAVIRARSPEPGARSHHAAGDVGGLGRGMASYRRSGEVR